MFHIAFLFIIHNASLFSFVVIHPDKEENPVKSKKKTGTINRTDRMKNKTTIPQKEAIKLQESLRRKHIGDMRANIAEMIQIKRAMEKIKLDSLKKIKNRKKKSYLIRELQPYEKALTTVLSEYSKISRKETTLFNKEFQIELDFDSSLAQQSYDGIKNALNNLEIFLDKIRADYDNRELVESFSNEWIKKDSTFFTPIHERFLDFKDREGFRKFQRQAKDRVFEKIADFKDYKKKIDTNMMQMNNVDTSMKRFEEAPDVSSETLKAGPEGLYDISRSLENYIGKVYTDVRAAELAIIENISFDEAFARLRTNRSERPDWGEKLHTTKKAETLEDIDKYSQTLTEAVNKTDKMRIRTLNMLSRITDMSMNFLSLTLKEGKKNSTLSLEKAFAIERHRGEGSKNNPVKSSQPGAGIGNIKQDSGEARGISLDRFTYNQDSYGMSGGRKMAFSLPKEELFHINEQFINANVLPGRKFLSESIRSGWIYIDTWYVIGPWENSGAIDYKNLHPPEQEIDFDMEYKDGKKDKDGLHRALKWRFMQSSSVRIIVPDEAEESTYYLYTDIYFERDTEMVTAFASDDAARVWITYPSGRKLLVWEDNLRSSWKMNEIIKKILFRKGYNQILVRLENGPTYCAFSMIFCPTEKPKP